VNPSAERTSILLDLTLKRRAAMRAIGDGTSLHRIIEQALRAYLKRGARMTAPANEKRAVRPRLPLPDRETPLDREQTSGSRREPRRPAR